MLSAAEILYQKIRLSLLLEFQKNAYRKHT